jgi:hypothetical protein
MGVQRTHVEVIPDRQVGAALLHQILNTTPLYQNGKFKPDVSYSHGDLDAFVEVSLWFKKMVEDQFDLTLRKDFKTKPMQHLQQLPKLVGLGQVSSNRRKLLDRSEWRL